MNGFYIKDPKSWTDGYETGHLYTMFDQMNGVSAYQNKCSFCHKTDDFTDMSELSKGVEYEYSQIWHNAFKEFLRGGDFTNAREIKHGSPNGVSIMIWREGKQKQSTILATLKQSNMFELGVSLRDILTKFSFCPVCGRVLGDDGE